MDLISKRALHTSTTRNLRASGNPVGSLLLGMGRSDLSLKWNCFTVTCTLATILVSSYWGIEGLAWGFVGMGIVFFVPHWLFLVQPLCRATLSAYVGATAKPLIIAALAIATPYPFCIQIDQDYLCLLTACAISFPLYIFLTYRYNPTASTSIWNVVNPKKMSLMTNKIS